jgi:acyl carrier protein
VAAADLEQFRADLHAELARLAQRPVESITGSLRLDEDLFLDSLKRIEALSTLSDKYEFDPDMDTVMELRTVDDIVRLAQAYFHEHEQPAP